MSNICLVPENQESYLHAVFKCQCLVNKGNFSGVSHRNYDMVMRLA